jgi:hypothetical protein
VPLVSFFTHIGHLLTVPAVTCSTPLSIKRFLSLRFGLERIAQQGSIVPATVGFLCFFNNFARITRKQLYLALLTGVWLGQLHRFGRLMILDQLHALSVNFDYAASEMVLRRVDYRRGLPLAFKLIFALAPFHSCFLQYGASETRSVPDRLLIVDNLYQFWLRLHFHLVRLVIAAFFENRLDLLPSLELALGLRRLEFQNLGLLLCK